ARIPVKVSCVLDEHNVPDVESFLRRCHAIGVRRVVLRKQFGDPRTFEVPLARVGEYRGNPVYELDGMEVTYWDFDVSQSSSINLFADGTIGSEYLLVKNVACG